MILDIGDGTEQIHSDEDIRGASAPAAPEQLTLLSKGDPTISTLTLAAHGNALLNSLSLDDRQFIIERARRMTFELGVVLHQTNESAHDAYFVESGVASVIKVDGAGHRTEVCMLGPEGFFGGAIVVGSERHPFEVCSQASPLIVIALPATALRELIARSPAAAALLTTAIYNQCLQVTDNLVSAVWQPVPARLARWLIMYRERVETDRLEITHAFMALMIGAQRSKVTSALHQLEASGSIASTRGVVQIRDIGLLRSAARQKLDRCPPGDESLELAVPPSS